MRKSAKPIFRGNGAKVAMFLQWMIACPLARFLFLRREGAE